MMNPIESVVTCLRKYAVFSGRASRSECWWFILVSMVFGSFIRIVSRNGLADMLSVGPLTLIGIFNLLIIVPMISVQVRRLHDVGMSGWWVGAFYSAMPVIIIFDIIEKNSEPVSLPLAIIGLIYFTIILVVGIFEIIQLLRPTNAKGDKYGPSEALTQQEAVMPMPQQTVSARTSYQPVEYVPKVYSPNQYGHPTTRRTPPRV